MRAADFASSARRAAARFADPELGVGELILEAVRATREAVSCNTNLGIVLLCAPLARAAREEPHGGALATRLAEVLARLDTHDARCAFAAIRLAEPAGLGRSPRHDVLEPARAGLLEAMREGAGRDRVAYQYAYDFRDVFELGLPALQRELATGRAWSWATVAVYLDFLSALPDTHIQRKFGAEVAMDVMESARQVRDRFRRLRDPAVLVRQLAPLDRDLKGRGLNPGTSADLTVATLFAHRLQRP